MQALRVPYRAVGTSEPNPEFREYQALNHEGIEHMHLTMEDQHRARPCTLHKHAESCDPCASLPGGCPQLAVFGTPCPPFSRQRTKRFAENSVREHQAFAVTFEDTFKWLQKFEPITALMEQVKGFNARESAGSTGPTPYERHAGVE